MNKKELLDYIETNVLDKNKKLKAGAMRYGYLEKIQNDLEIFIKDEGSLQEKLYLFYYGGDKKYCYCGQETEFIGFTRGYREYCSLKCMSNSKKILDKKRETSLKKYGTEIPQKTIEVKEKQKITMQKKYGGFTFNSLELKSKVDKTNIKRYGTKYISQAQKIKDKKQQTLLNKYGVKNAYQISHIKEKAFFNKNRKKALELISNLKLIEPLFSIEEYDSVFKTYKWKCNLCKNEFEDYLINNHPYCPFCHKKFNGSSGQEKEISDFISNFNVKQINNSRNIIPPLELDIYLPDYNLAIEFDGLYWHSEQKGADKNYHLLKTEECEKQGIQLIHIFEDEWLHKQDIVKSRLKNILGKNSRRIGARQTIIKEIDSKTKNQFLERYHIQGRDTASIKLGAFFGDELVGVMTFSKPRIFMNKKNKDGVYELSRFSTIEDAFTPGLASKLLKHFERNYEWVEIYSYADRRWSQGDLYLKLGFKFIKNTTPNYWYWKNHENKRYHRYKFRKSVLKNFVNYSENKTEKQIMDEAGWFRIYDSGNMKFSKQYLNSYTIK